MKSFKKVLIRQLSLCVILFALGFNVVLAVEVYKLENNALARIISVKNDIVSTSSIINKRAKKVLKPLSCEEFSLRVSQETAANASSVTLTAKDFTVTKVTQYTPGGNTPSQGLAVALTGRNNGLSVVVHYEIFSNDFYSRKFLEISSDKDITIERFDVESIAFEDAFQNYTQKMITANAPSGWKPGLGQPVYTTKTATFWGVEFPASTNIVTDKNIHCGYLWGNKLKANQVYVTYKSVVGVADNQDFIDEAFYAYIDCIRKRPLRLQIQYNSWFDFGQSVSKESFAKSIETITEELVNKRGSKPLNAFVIDDGWQDSFDQNANWTDSVWQVNKKFDPNFSGTFNSVKNARSNLGLWLSPGCFFGANKMVNKLRENGYEALTLSMSMTGPKYMQRLENRVLELTKMGVSYFKMDGLFGHLNLRDFELNGRGTPAMPQFDFSGFSANDIRLNDKKYDEVKTYYLVAGTERLITIFDKMAEINPSVYIAITNGAYLSPWWLQYVDIVWMINAGDAAGGNSRTDELTYRDNIYYQIWKTENTKFPMCAIFNHEPKKTNTSENPDTFKDYLFMNLSRGTGFIELYLKTKNLTPADWDILADGLKWAKRFFPVFKNVRMHGGNPSKNEVYGYTAWNHKQGYLSMHNPSDSTQHYSIILDRKIGLIENKSSKFKLCSSLKIESENLSRIYKYGQKITFDVKPKEIKLLEFSIL
jgi:hypothetical protein